MINKNVLLVPMVSLALTACSSLTGFDAGSKFACAAPDGVTCMSMTGVNANIDAGNLGNGERPVSHAKEADTYYGDRGVIAHQAIKSGTPIRTAPKKMRVWYAPWEDADGDLNDQSYSYMVIDTGRWVMERVRSEIVQNFMPGTGPSSLTPMSTPGSETTTPPAPENIKGKKAPATLGQNSLPMNGVQVPSFDELMEKVGVGHAGK